MIVCNGCPRTGTHLVMKFLGMLGLRDSGHVLLSLSEREPLRARVLLSEKKKRPTAVESTLGFGDEYFAHAHVSHHSALALQDHKVITTYRDPRNSAISMILWHAFRGKLPEGIQAGDEDALVDLLERGYYSARRDRTWVKFVRGFEEWRDHGLALEFNELGTLGGARKIAEFVGYPCPELRLKKLVKGWRGGGKLYADKPMFISMSSYLPKPSRWQEWWTPRVCEVWEKIKGPKLLEDMGYA